LSGRARGYTLVELVVVCAVLIILAAIALPSTRYTWLRIQEMELHSALRQMRAAIDEHKRYADAGLIPIEFGTDGYPEDLEILAEGVEVIGQVDKKVRFLRRVPVDPMTGEAEWGLRSYEDEPDSTSWGGENVFDVYSLSNGTGLNGVPYSEW